MRKIVVIALLALLTIVSQAQVFLPMRVVVSHALLADVAQQVGGENVIVATLVPANEPVTEHELTGDDLQTADDGDLVLLNGAGLEPFLADLIPNINTPYWIVSEGLDILGKPAATFIEPDAEASIYMMLSNQTDQDLALITAEGDWFNGAMTHATNLSGDLASMSELEEGIWVDAQGDTLLEPGGIHLMLMGIRQNLDEGEQYPLTLRFSDGSELEVMVEATSEGIALGSEQTVAENDTVRVIDAWTYPMTVLFENETPTDNRLGALFDDVTCGDNPAETNPADCNPYLWTDSRVVAQWAQNIALIYAEYDPDNADFYQANADAYVAQLAETDAKVETLLAPVLNGQPLIVPDDSMAYFAERYGITLQIEQGASVDFNWLALGDARGNALTYSDYLLQNVEVLVNTWAP